MPRKLFHTQIMIFPQSCGHQIAGHKHWVCWYISTFNWLWWILLCTYAVQSVLSYV